MEVSNRAHLQLTQHSCDTLDLKLSGDLLVVVSSWESRCTEVLNCRSLVFDSAAVITFEERGISGRRDSHDELLLCGIADVARNLVTFPSYSVFDYEQWKETLQDLLVGAFTRKGAPIKVVIDGSCCPKFYLLFLIGFCLRTGLAYEVSVFYAPGRYAGGAHAEKNIEEYVFTYGNWRALLVPYLEGALEPDKRSRLIVTTGFETFQARRFIQAYECDHHELIIAYPGFLPEYDSLASLESEALIAHLAVTDAHVTKRHAGDALGVASVALSLMNDPTFNDVGLCLGTKPHSVGLAMASLVDERLTVICRRPEEYAETDVAPIGRAWLYGLLDKSSLAPFEIENQKLEEAEA